MMFIVFLIKFGLSLLPSSRSEVIEMGPCHRTAREFRTIRAGDRDLKVVVAGGANWAVNFQWDATPPFPQLSEWTLLRNTLSVSEVGGEKDEDGKYITQPHPMFLAEQEHVKANTSNHYYVMGCAGGLGVQWVTPGKLASNAHTRYLFFLGKRRGKTQVKVEDDGALTITFQNGDQMRRAPNTFAPLESECFKEPPRGIRRQARGKTYIRPVSALEYTCDGAVMEFEANTFPSPNAHVLVYSNKCGGPSLGVRLEAIQLVQNTTVRQNVDAIYKFSDPSEAALRLLPASSTCLRQQIMNYEPKAPIAAAKDSAENKITAPPAAR